MDPNAIYQANVAVPGKVNAGKPAENLQKKRIALINIIVNISVCLLIL